MDENKNVCPCCEEGCDLSVPGCARGEEYVRTGVIPEEDRHGRRCGRGGHGGHGRPCGHGRHGPAGGGHRGGHKSILDSERYSAMDTDGKLLAMIHALGHAGRFAFGGKGGQGRILHILAKEGTMTQRALTERLGIQPGSASEIIGKLERAGLILRTASEADKRTADISLTEAGSAQAARQAEERNARKRELFSALTEEEKASLLSNLEKLIRSWSALRSEEHSME